MHIIYIYVRVHKCVYTNMFTHFICTILTAVSIEAGMPGGLILVNTTSSNGEVHTRAKMNVKQGEDQIAFHAPVLHY